MKRFSAEQRHAGDGLQPMLLRRFGFQLRLMPGVRLLGSLGGRKVEETLDDSDNCTHCCDLHSEKFAEWKSLKLRTLPSSAAFLMEEPSRFVAEVESIAL